MRVVVVSAGDCKAGACDLERALAEAAWSPSSLASPIDDGLAAHVTEHIESISHGSGAEAAVQAEALLVITTGQDYVCAELVRRANRLGVPVHVHVKPWRQVALW